MILHNPVIDVKRIEEMYSKKDGIPVKYLCTTEFIHSRWMSDIFYRATPHPVFGNRYFGIELSPRGSYIFNADPIETDDFFVFTMITNEDGNLAYSRDRHDLVNQDNLFIDGGRTYVRTNADLGALRSFKIKDGSFYEIFN